MPVIKGLGWTFDTVAAAYEKMRPGYADRLYESIFGYAPIHESSRVLEIGSGGGQATEPVLKTGCSLTAVECGAHFSSLLKEKFQAYPKFSVITTKFEDAALEENSYDLVLSASAFHWIPEREGYEKVYSILKKRRRICAFCKSPLPR